MSTYILAISRNSKDAWCLLKESPNCPRISFGYWGTIINNNNIVRGLSKDSIWWFSEHFYTFKHIKQEELFPYLL